jgi:hypothetical protein
MAGTAAGAAKVAEAGVQQPAAGAAGATTAGAATTGLATVVQTGRYVVKGTYRTCRTKEVMGAKAVVGQPVHGSHDCTQRYVVTGTLTHSAR